MGLGAGMQKLRYLPEAHTDFVFAVIGEELGLVGTLGVISLFLVVLWSGVTIARRAKDSFGWQRESFSRWECRPRSISPS